MRVVRHPSASAFVGAAEQFLRSDPFTTSVIAVVADRVNAGSITPQPDHLWVTVEEADGEVAGVAMQTPPHRLFVSRMPPPAVAALAEALVTLQPGIGGVTGELGATTAFTTAWSAITGARSAQITGMRMYRLGELAAPTGVPGHTQRATAAEIGLVATWTAAFHDEALHQAPSEDWNAWARRRIDAGEVHLWLDRDEPVAEAGVSAPASGVARVGPVYTPPAHRRRGYGAAVTAAATRAALDAGAAHVVLYTDLSNPTSNSIYQTIGYRPHHDAEERSFFSPVER